MNKWKQKAKMIGTIAVAIVAIVLLVSAVRTTNKKDCTGLQVEVVSPSNNFFVSEKEVKTVINDIAPVVGLPIASINLQKIEARLKENKWIESAEVFFDKDHVLQVKVEENEPVARIFTAAGSSYYIDSSCRHLPLSKSVSARVPMFTNFPSDRNRLSRRDSALMAIVKDMAVYMLADEFWKAQVAQIDITPSGFEMIPTIGNHVVVLGNGNDLQEKFDRLYTFYKQVWTKVGLNAYEKIDVQFKGQVVATLKGAATVQADTAQAKIALQQLLAKAAKQDDDVAIPVASKEQAVTTPQPIPARQEKAENDKKEKAIPASKVEPVKDNNKVPKAVMGKRNG